MAFNEMVVGFLEAGTDHVLNHQNLHGDKILAFETEPVIEIDTEDHLKDLQRIAEFSPIYQRLVG
jgi:hypothetical protein